MNKMNEAVNVYLKFDLLQDVMVTVPSTDPNTFFLNKKVPYSPQSFI